MQTKILKTGVTITLASMFVGCSNLPGSDQQQGAVIGGASGAAVGAAVSKENRALGAVIGGALGAAGGYVVGANSDRILGRDNEAAKEAAREAQQNPATPEQVRAATTADVNNDGFVTLDELAAMEEAGLSDDEMLARLRATGQIFDLSAEQKQDLLNRGVSPTVVAELPSINAHKKQEILQQPADPVISGQPL